MVPNRLSASWIERESRAVAAATARAEQLQAAGARCVVRLRASGAEVEIQRPARRGKVTVSWEVFPF